MSICSVGEIVKHIFGPVPSRRLGLSLGIDLVPYKTCNLDCVYCEVGRTLKKRTKREPFATTEEIMYELVAHLINKSPPIDYFTLSGAGEPTLNQEMGTIISAIKQEFPKMPLALITNGTLFWDPVVRSQVRLVDVILPSLDAVSRQVFNQINRPSSTLNNDKIIEGLISLREEFPGKIWVEIFLVPGLNDSPSELLLFKKTLEKIAPDKIHLNSLNRPSAEAWVKMESMQRLEQIAEILSPLPVEIMAKLCPSKKLAKQEQKEHTREILKHIDTLAEESVNQQKK